MESTAGIETRNIMYCERMMAGAGASAEVGK